ncbi:hypothetical protein ACFCZ1_21435 [Streptomyces sp. NPDC056224]|uniref:hypothetical protein n=1 Tax=Streptomyces sp. NPDC056224 TaxID=3345750 RepID=UPI0035E0F8BB
MAGMGITVCLAGEARGRLAEAIGEAMAPFECDYRRGEELDVWDHWAISGGGSGFQPLRGREGDPRLVPDGPAPSGRCAGGPRELLAFAEIRAEAVEVAGAAWDLWRELARLHPPAEPLAPVVPWSNPAEAEASWQARIAARQAYEAQPLVIAYEERRAALLAGHRGYRLGDSLGHAWPVEDVGGVGREEFVRLHAESAVPGGSVLTLDGWWCEPGDQPLHGACEGPAVCPHTPPFEWTDAPWYHGSGRYLEELPGDTVLVRVRCHV